MRTYKANVFDLFEKQHRYLVPLFQRGHVWGRADQWEPLWQDVLVQAALVREAALGGPRPARKHFLGAIVLNRVDTPILRLPCSEVVDGQQRLLTLQVLLAALHDGVAGLVNPYLAGMLGRLTANPGPFAHRDEQLKVWPLGTNRDDLRSVTAAGSPEALAARHPGRRSRGRPASPRSPLVEAYLYFGREVADYLKGEGRGGEHPSRPASGERRAEALIEAVTRRVQLISIELEAEDDPQVIFETLNARGVPLAPSDLIRNFLFVRAVRHGGEAERIYRRWWREFDEPGPGEGGFWKETERLGQAKRSRLDLFLFHYLTFRTRRVLSSTQLFQAFRDWWEEPGPARSVEAELEALHRSAAVFRALLQPDGDSPLGRLGGRPRDLNAAAAYPLVLWLAERRDAVPDSEFEGMLEDLGSLLQRRAASGSSARSYPRALVGVLDRLHREGEPGREALRRELEGLDWR